MLRSDVFEGMRYFYFLNSDAYTNMRMMIKAFSVRISSLLLKQKTHKLWNQSVSYSYNEQYKNLSVVEYIFQF